MTEEEAFVKAFVALPKQARLLALLADPKRRRQFLDTLAHFKDFDPRWMVELKADQQHSHSIEQELSARGAGNTCYVMSENRSLDGQTLPLALTLQQVIGYGMGTVVSCLPGRLAYFEGEGPSDRYLLIRNNQQ